MSAGYPTFIRNYNRIPGRQVATEHTMETYTEEVYKLATKRGWTNMSKEMRVGRNTVAASDWKDGFTPWAFNTGTPNAGNISTIKYGFWTGYTDYDVTWKYDAATNTYQRFQGAKEEKHIDSNNNEQIAASNVVVVYAKEEGPLNDKAHLLYGLIGTGNAVLFKNGEQVDIKWSKKDREAPMLFTDNAGKDVELTAGMVWVSVVDTANKSLQAN